MVYLSTLVNACLLALILSCQPFRHGVVCAVLLYVCRCCFDNEDKRHSATRHSHVPHTPPWPPFGERNPYTLTTCREIDYIHVVKCRDYKKLEVHISPKLVKLEN